MTKFEDIKQTVEAVSGSRWWIEEILIRGKPSEAAGGEAQGAHFSIGAEFPAPDGGEPMRRLYGPLPIDELGDKGAMGMLIGDAVKAQQTAIASLQSQIADAANTITERESEITQGEATITKMSEQLAAMKSAAAQALTQFTTAMELVIN